MNNWIDVKVLDLNTTPLGRAEEEDPQASGLIASAMVELTDPSGKVWTQPVEVMRRDGDILVLMWGKKADPIICGRVFLALLQSTGRSVDRVGASMIADRARRLADDLEEMAPTRDLNEAKALYDAAAGAKMMALYAERHGLEMATAYGGGFLEDTKRAYAERG